MAARERILVSDLNKMSAEELRQRGIISLKDPENLTAEHMEKLKRLLNGELDLGAVNEKLCNLADAAPTNSRSRSSSSATPDPNDPVIAANDRLNSYRRENEAYIDLIQDGWQPSHCPSESSFDFLLKPENHTDIVSYWFTMCHGVEDMLQQQRWHWGKFRKHQDWRRWRYWKPEWFERFVQEVREYRQKKGLEGNISLLQDRKEQSRLQDWVEFQYWEYKKADQHMKEREIYVKKVIEQEERLQAAIDAGQPAEEIGMIRDHSLALMKGRRGGAEIDLQRQKVLMKWIDEQLSIIIASECQIPAVSTQLPNSNQTATTGTSLGKRKRSTDQIDHCKDSSRRVEYAEQCDTEIPSAKHADVLSSELADLAENEAPQMSNARHRRHDAEHHKSVLQKTNCSGRKRLRANPVRTQGEGRSLRARSGSSGLCPRPAMTPAEKEVTFQTPKAELATSAVPSKRRNSIIPATQSTTLERVHSSRVSKTRGRTRTKALPEAARRNDARQPAGKRKQKDKPTAARRVKNMAQGGREKQHLANIPVRRSSRLKERSKICYSK